MIGSRGFAVLEAEAIRAALEALAAGYLAKGREVRLSPGATDEALAALPNAVPDDYRALLAMHDGATFGYSNVVLLASSDLRGGTPLAARAKEYIEMSAEWDAPELLDCVAVVYLGQPNDWVLFDPKARRYLYCLNADRNEEENIAAVIDRCAAVNARVE